MNFLPVGEEKDSIMRIAVMVSRLGALSCMLSGCASYRAVSLPMLQSEFCPTAQTVSGITACTKVLSEDDCRKYFDKNLIKKGFQPIQLSVHNNTNRYLVLKRDSFSLPLVPAEQVAGKAHRNTTGRATAYGVAGIIIWPLLIPAIVDGVGSSRANQQMNADFAAKGIDDTLIQPYSKVNGVVFTSTDGFDGSFTLTLLDREQATPFRFSWPRPVAHTTEPTKVVTAQASPTTPWEQVRAGMTTAQVKDLLGEPSEVSEGKDSLVWFYHDMSNSHVTFRDGGVASWRGP